MIGGTVRELHATESPSGPTPRGGTLLISLLGGTTVRWTTGQQVTRRSLGTAKNRQLLRILAVRADRPISSDELVDLLWPDADERRGHSSLRTAVCALRRQLGPEHLAREGRSLVLADVRVDTLQFEDLAARARRHFAVGELDEGLRAAELACALFRGPLEQEEPRLDLLRDLGTHLEMLHGDLRVGAGEAALRAGRPADAVAAVGPVFEHDPTHERACRALMQGYHLLDERSVLTRIYRRCQQALLGEFGLAPTDRTSLLFAELSTDARQARPIAVGGGRGA